MTNDLGVLAQLAYGAGIAPLDYAEYQVAILIGVHAAIAQARPGVFPGAQTSPDVVACRILGVLLDAGWKVPEVPDDQP